MAEIKRMRKILMLITSVRVEIQLNLYKNVHWTVFEEEYCSMGPVKIHNGGNYTHTQELKFI